MDVDREHGGMPFVGYGQMHNTEELMGDQDEVGQEEEEAGSGQGDEHED